MAWNKPGNRHSQGYGTAWDKLRVRILARDAYSCVPCRERDGAIRPAHAVDHIVPKSQGGTDAMSNLQAICTDCHQQKTLEEAAAAQGRTYRPKPRVGLDGWPA